MSEKIEIIDITANNITEYGFCGFKKPSKTEGYQKNGNGWKNSFLME